MRKFTTRMARRPTASRMSRNGSRDRPEKLRAIKGPLKAPMTMIALFATATF
jgi:hypothetical protein